MIKTKIFCFSVILLFLFSSAHILVAQHYKDTNNVINQTTSLTENDWYLQPQIYDMAAMPSEMIDEYHITVNGLWNGFIGDNLSSPFALGRLLESVFGGNTFESDADFVQAQHDKGMIVPGTILTIQGHRSFQQDDFDTFASRSVDGSLCPWDKGADSYWMNILDPGYLEWCINHGKKAIDAGADIIVLDEIQGNSLIPTYQWASQYTGDSAPGFSNVTINGFQQYLIETYSSSELSDFFGILDINTYDLKPRLAQTMNLVYEDRIKEDPLIEDYAVFLEQSNFEAKKELILALRNYAASKQRGIVISANSYALGSSQTFGFWSKGLIFADLIDLFTFENTYTAFMDKPIPDFYRSKWLAWERLAYAATDAPAVILVDTNTLKAINENLFPLFGFSNSLGVLCAEAFANRGSFVNYNYNIPVFSRDRNWNKVEQIHDFVMQHKDLYYYDHTVFGDVGILFLYGEGMRSHWTTYLGCAQALAESHIPFEVIFDGDGYYLNSSLTIDEIKDFPLLIVPSVLKITLHQEQVLKSYVQQGGVAIVFDAASLGFSDETGEMSYGEGWFYFIEDNLGKEYFETYDDEKRQAFVDIIDTYDISKLEVSSNNRRVVVTPYVDGDVGRLILHVVNYDHIGFFDFLWPQSNIEIQIEKPDFQVESIQLYHMDGSFIELTLDNTDSSIHFTVPWLKDYVVIVIE